MFKRFFSKEEASPAPVSPAKRTETMEEGGSTRAADDTARDFWRNLNLTKGKNKVYRRLKDIVNQLPEHVVNRLRQIDQQLAHVLTHSHKIVALVIHEVLGQNMANPLMLEGSREWDIWFETFEKKCFAFRRDVADDLGKFLSKLHYKEKDVDRLNSLVSAKPGELEQLTGLDKIEDLKSNLIDVAILLGKDSESRLINSMSEEPVRNIIDSFEYNLEFFEKMMSASSSRIKIDIEKCWRALSIGPVESDAAGGGNQSVLYCYFRKSLKISQRSFKL